jgi:hypothetical protein
MGLQIGASNGEGREIMRNRTLKTSDGGRQTIDRGRAGVYILSIFLLIISCNTSFAKASDAQKNIWLLDVIFKLERMKDSAAADIKKCDLEIQKAENTIRKSEDIIRLAKQKNNIQAETIAGQALRAAREARRKNKDRKDLAEHNIKRAGEILAYMREGGNNPEAMVEQLELENDRAEWTKNQKKLIEEGLAERNSYIDPIYRSLKTKAPPKLPPTKYDMLKPGDVLMISPEGKSFWNTMKDSAFWIDTGDRIASVSLSPASHALVYLKEVNGKKLFLDHTPGEGSRVISEGEFLKTYSHRDAQVAQPVKEVDAAKLWEAAGELSKREAQIKANKSNNIIDQTGFGLYGNKDMVCSEASRWALVNSGFKLPETSSPLKKLLGIHYSPANFYSDDKNFIITPLYEVPK